MNHEMVKDTMKELPEAQRPYEKCIREGVEALSDSELLAVILRSGTQGMNSLTLANKVLSLTKDTAYPGLLGLMRLSLQDLMKVNGIGKVKAIQLKCIGELSKRMASAAAKPRISFRDPETIARYYMERLRHEEQELLFVMMFDNRNHLLGEHLVTKGTANATLVTPREIFLEALRYRAVCLILVHNHPSGDPSPSDCDIAVTEQIFKAGELVGISLLDHIIIGDQRYFSFRSQGLMKEYL
ncbi:DNA repair protein RadC [Ruminococcus sp. 5_1_39BFAA]|uniref:RadC family protein n=1 Tax=Ruminococcus sp. 5_1_39BFAA TaxID=457412 RepID=UPI003561E930